MLNTFSLTEDKGCATLWGMKKALPVVQLVEWLRLIRSERVGPRTFIRLLKQFGTASEALKNLPNMARRGGGSGSLRIATKSEVMQELERAETLGMVPIAACEPAYPPALAQIGNAPPVIYAMGDLSFLQKTMVGIVGTRYASTNGIAYTKILARDLGQANLVVISGLARGIDTAAHVGSLATGTVAVLAGGLDMIYPKENERLYYQIKEMGCLISEMPPETKIQRRFFPARNRLIAGSAMGLVLVEGAIHSGSVITADLANEFGRTVFAVPGHPSDARSAGPNAKIREGAVLINGAQDILAELEQPSFLLEDQLSFEFSVHSQPMPAEDELQEARLLVLEALSSAPVTIDSMIEQCQVSSQIMAVVLLELELAGRLERSTGQKVSLLSGELY